MRPAVWALAFLLSCGGEAEVEVPPVEPGACAPECAANERCQEGVCLGSVAWTLDMAVNVQGEVAVTDEGLILASTAQEVDRLYRPSLVAISPDGQVVWERPLAKEGPYGFPSRPVLGKDGRIYVVINFSLFALDPTGYLKWSLDTPVADGQLAVNAALPAPAPAIGVDGTIYWQFLAATGVYGDLKWRQYIDPETPCETALPVRPDRVLLRGGQQLFALNEAGEVAWNLYQPLDHLTEPGCGMIPYRDGLVASLWCEEGPSAFVCGDILFVDVETGEVKWHTPPPERVAMASAILMRPDGSLALFSVGATGNPEDPALMWLIAPDGKSNGPAIALPWRGIYHAALGDDGIFYVTTSAGLAALSEEGEVLWTYEPERAVGSFSGPPAIGANGCIYYEAVKGLGGRSNFARELACVRSTATGLADSPWPRSLGGNHSAMRSP